MVKKSVEFSAYDGMVGLNVKAWIFVVNAAGAFELLESGAMIDLGLGSYGYSFDADTGKTYIAKMRVYTDNTFTTFSDTYPAPGSEIVEPTYFATAVLSKKAVEFSTYDGQENLNVKCWVYELRPIAGTFNLVAQGAMSELFDGVYAFSFTAEPDKRYIARMRVYTDNTFTSLHGTYPAPGSENIGSTYVLTSINLTFRQKVDGLLGIVGQTTLTDDEFAELESSYDDKTALYLELNELLGERGASEYSLNRLKYLFLGLGASIDVAIENAAKKSNIFMGAAL